jgi:peptidyl-prolyl cis-trans isomerase A (cyclophilin A)
VLNFSAMRTLLAAFAIALALLAVPAAQAKSKKVVKEGNMVEMKTSMGTIKIELNPDKAPLTVANFQKYAKDGFYDGTIFHRVISNFMIQGGGYDKAMNRKETRDPVKNESSNGLKNETGTIAMARTSDVDSATAQWFINTKDNASLDYPSMGGYTVFGKVVEGMDVVKKIEAVKTSTQKGMKDVPVDQVVIESVRLIGAK